MNQRLLATRTTTQLLNSLRDPENEVVWQQIDRRYRSVIASFVRRLGLNQSDSEEVAQQTMAEFVRAYRDGRYQRSEGILSSWILGIAHNNARRVLRQHHRDSGSPAVTDAEPAEEMDLSKIWAQERDRELFGDALRILRTESGIDARTMETFELVALRGLSANDVAQSVGMNVDQVYVIKSRITKRLRELVMQLTEAFEQDT